MKGVGTQLTLISRQGESILTTHIYTSIAASIIGALEGVVNATRTEDRG
jgi:hypothetical protein